MIDTAIIEKDYYVSIVLNTLNAKYENLVFRGGTSLSKCFGLINRFSEDIDLSVDVSAAPLTEGKRKQLKKAILATFDELGLQSLNPDDTRSRRDYNRYVTQYESIYSDTTAVKNEVIIETYLATIPTPNTEMKVGNYIYQLLQKIDRPDIVQQYQVAPFEMKVQDIRRSYIDKVFALCDYCLQGKTDNHSRHIYDLYMLDGQIDFTPAFAALVRDVRAVRKNIAVCDSAKDGVNINELLSIIVESECYKQDYLSKTEQLLFTPVPYEIAVRCLNRTIQANCFADGV
ncbi:MAG: nucleotidyl transferase AbiEii/AbiGii toxin family protein [Clostridiales Family XIII bacterium]|nr:nucleotidyl transferase AbiEii/AbiGii toxin family protein [Clostridiales Family XIII bacterium]